MSDKKQNIPAIPSIDLSLPENIKSHMRAVKTVIEIRENQNPNADILDKRITYQDLIDLGLITKSELPS